MDKKGFVGGTGHQNYRDGGAESRRKKPSLWARETLPRAAVLHLVLALGSTTNFFGIPDFGQPRICHEIAE